ncbi:hypothetical protein KY312_03885, partial [Candidatus Woesearchaeota archaeon]|nr:hypothetical protein [Candidatus Woesearchaeota archaeon]
MENIFKVKFISRLNFPYPIDNSVKVIFGPEDKENPERTQWATLALKPMEEFIWIVPNADVRHPYAPS